MEDLRSLAEKIIRCRRCPRLVKYRRWAAEHPPKRYRGERYWAKPLPGFGDPEARIMAVGLAPAAHGGNRTGRMWTGDGAGNTLMRSLYNVGLANRPDSRRADDGLALRGIYLTAVLRCPPPENKPTSDEIRNCVDYLRQELMLLRNVSVVVALGSIAFNTVIRLLREMGVDFGRPIPKFRHGLVLEPGGSLGGRKPPIIIASYHPSRQNTQTGKLTQEMLDQVFEKALRYAGAVKVERG